jgi:hypothetical protein
VELFRYGSVPHAGFDLKLARMVAYASELTNVLDAILFPRTPGRARYGARTIRVGLVFIASRPERTIAPCAGKGPRVPARQDSIKLSLSLRYRCR